MAESLESRLRKAEKRSRQLAELLQEVDRIDFEILTSERNALSVDIELMNQQKAGKWTPLITRPDYNIPNIL